MRIGSRCVKCCGLCVQLDLAKSRRHVLQGEITAFKRDLAEDMYKNADVKHRDKMIELKVCLFSMSI